LVLAGDIEVIMERPFTYAAAALVALSSISQVSAKEEHEPRPQQPAGNPARAAAENQALQNAQREQKAQQDQQRQQQMQQQMQQQAEARKNQEQAMRAQEEQARKAQMDAIKMQQAEARQAQEQMRQNAGVRAKQEHDQAAQIQREQEPRSRQPNAPQVGNAQPNRQLQPANVNERMPGNQRPAAGAAAQPEQREARQEHGGPGMGAQGQHMNPGASFVRAAKPKPLSATVVPTAKAVSMPVLEPGASPQEQEHAAAATKNLQARLIAVQGNQAPQNVPAIRNSTVNNYFNNYRTTINNRQISINRQNTNFNIVPPTQFPHWYQPEPGWTYSNGFCLGNLITVGADWLGWGWHPYYGPPPEGFVCESDYIPTPWVYVPAAGLWRQPGVMGYADYGPPYDYEGPITVEVMEPRHIHVRDPFTGWMNDRVVNVVYFYNAYYYPEFERYGYMNRHGYFIWLNLDESDDY
jgi:hypothetical protein